MIAFVQVTDMNGNAGYIRADAIESLACEQDTGVTRVFVNSSGYYRVKDSQLDVLIKLRDIESLQELEGME